jgi:hypothetical protein
MKKTLTKEDIKKLQVKKDAIVKGGKVIKK